MPEITCRGRVVPAIDHSGERPEWTIALVEISGARLSAALQEAGFEPGDTVTITLDKRRAPVALPEHPWGPYGSPRPEKLEREHRPLKQAA
jgi:hypothetical protein